MTTTLLDDPIVTPHDAEASPTTIYLLDPAGFKLLERQRYLVGYGELIEHVGEDFPEFVLDEVRSVVHDNQELVPAAAHCYTTRAAAEHSRDLVCANVWTKLEREVRTELADGACRTPLAEFLTTEDPDQAWRELERRTHELVKMLLVVSELPLRTRLGVDGQPHEGRVYLWPADAGAFRVRGSYAPAPLAAEPMTATEALMVLPEELQGQLALAFWQATVTDELQRKPGQPRAQVQISAESGDAFDELALQCDRAWGLLVARAFRLVTCPSRPSQVIASRQFVALHGRRRYRSEIKYFVENYAAEEKALAWLRDTLPLLDQQRGGLAPARICAFAPDLVPLEAERTHTPTCPIVELRLGEATWAMHPAHADAAEARLRELATGTDIAVVRSERILRPGEHRWRSTPELERVWSTPIGSNEPATCAIRRPLHPFEQRRLALEGVAVARTPEDAETLAALLHPSSQERAF